MKLAAQAQTRAVVIMLVYLSAEKTIITMEMDLVLACLLILLGAMVAYTADERLGFTRRLSDWISRAMGEY